MSRLTLESILQWAPHPKARPFMISEDHETFTLAANSSRTCCGGWQLNYRGFMPGRSYRIKVRVEYRDLKSARDALACFAYWGEIDPVTTMAEPKEEGDGIIWDYIAPIDMSKNRVIFGKTITSPRESSRLTIRYAFRWMNQGESFWGLPEIEESKVSQVSARKNVAISVVTGNIHSRLNRITTIKENIQFYSNLCQAAAENKVDLIVLPESALQWQVPGNILDLGIRVPGPETDVFQCIARELRTYILIGVIEQDEDAIYNSAVLLAPDGRIIGKYRKVHLACGEALSGILPGENFPVFDTEIGRIGCNICMDTSAAESSRLVGLKGADFLLMPIEGDNRADRWSLGPSTTAISRGRPFFFSL